VHKVNEARLITLRALTEVSGTANIVDLHFARAKRLAAAAKDVFYEVHYELGHYDALATQIAGQQSTLYNLDGVQRFAKL